MKKARKIFLILFIATLAMVGITLGTLTHFYHHPGAFKPFLEKALSRATGGAFSVRSLTYSLRPLNFRAEGIRLAPGKGLRGLDLEIPRLEADMTLEGPFGHRRLVLTALRVQDFSCKVSREIHLPEMTEAPGATSLFSRALKGLAAVFLFRDVAFHAAEVDGGHISAMIGDRAIKADEIRAKINEDRLMEISCSLRGTWPAKGMTFTAPRVQIFTDQAFSPVDPEIKATFEAKAMSLESPRVRVRAMDWTGSLDYRHGKRTLTLEPLKIDLQGLVLNGASGDGVPPLNLTVEAAGSLDVAAGKASVSAFHLALGDMMDLKGGFQGGLGAEPGIDLELRQGRIHPGRLRPFIPEPLSAALTDVALSGPVSFRGEGHGRVLSGRWEWDCDLGVQLQENAFSFAHREATLEGNLKGELRVRGRFPDLEISGKLGVGKTAFSGIGIRSEPFDTTFFVNFKRPLLSLKDLGARMPLLTLTTGTASYTVGDIDLRIPAGTVDLEKGSVSLPRADLDTSLLKNLRLTFAREGEKTAVTLEGKETRLIETAAAFDLTPPGWRFSGRDALEIRALKEKAGTWFVTSKVVFNDLALANRDSSCMGEGIGLTTEIHSRIKLGGPKMQVEALLKIHGGEILYDRFYLNLGKNSFSSSFEGTCGIPPESVEISRLDVEFKDLLNIEIRGTLLPKAADLPGRLALHIPETPLKPIFRSLVLEPFKAERPFLTALDAGGSLSADLELIGFQTGWQLKGHCLWREGKAVLGDDGPALEGIDLDLPVWVASRPGGKIEGPLAGRLTIRSMVLPFLPVQPLDLNLRGEPNRLSLRDPTALRVPGGQVRFGPVVLDGLFPLRPSLRTSLSVEAVDLAPALSTVWDGSMGGIMQGRLDLIHVQGNRLTTRGEIKAEIFGGEVVIHDLGAAGILTPAPVFRLDARWRDLNLAELTGDTAFGKVEGRLKGHVKDLEIAYGQPQRFDLLLETVEQTGVTQKISVKAVDNIARIGGGQSPFMGVAGVFSSFFREFPYEKIGVHASLENDVFRINGTVKEDGTEYLVKRGSFSGVNVVNRNPDNRISFKDMVKRIKRVTTSRRGPVAE